MNKTDSVFLNPQPIPPKDAVDYLVSLVAQRELLLEADGAETVWVSQIDAAVNRFVDEYCGTRPPRPFPPFPFLQLDVTAVLTEIAVRANSLTEGRLRDGLVEVARKIVTPDSMDNARTQQPTCEELASRIQQQDAQIQALQEELQNAPTPRKGALASMIMRATRIYERLVRQAEELGCPVPTP